MTQITHTGGHQADLSRDGRVLAYDSIPAGEHSTDSYVADADGTGARDVTNDPATNDLQPDISPDGHLVAYSSGTAGVRDAHIVVLDLRTGVKRQITAPTPGTEQFDPSWSPNGRWIVFDTLPRGANGALWMVRSNGRDLRKITTDAEDACQPDWGKNNLIAYAGWCDQLQTHLFLRDV